MKRFGIFLFLTGLLVLFASMWMSHYRLTGGVLKESLTKEEHYALLEPELQHLFGKEINSKFVFIREIRQAVSRINAPLKASGQWERVIYDNYAFLLTKNASEGILVRKQGLWFGLSFLLGLGGALLYILPTYGKGPPGIRNNHIFQKPLTNRGWIGIIIGSGLILFYIVLYWFPEYLSNWVVLVDPLSRAISGHPASQWFLYGFLYTLAILVMGVRMLLKYRHSAYHLIRTLSVMFFQTVFAFLIPEILVALNKPYYDFKNIWPLDYDFFYSYSLDELLASGSFGLFILVWGILLIILTVPLLTYFYGKRWYCSWVCGCGGLAETAGDPFRQLSDKSLKAWKIERWMVHGVLVFAVLTTAVTLGNYFTGFAWLGGATAQLHTVYGFAIGAVFAGVVGTGFYPLMGNRVWCRFGCPLAAYLGIVQRFKSRFRITVNGSQCISCGNCSVYCEMGIDVRTYAQRGQNVIRSSCVGCGVCAAVCPRGVLSLENGPEKGRFKTIADEKSF